jgi:hypothetical protein
MLTGSVRLPGQHQLRPFGDNNAHSYRSDENQDNHQPYENAAHE